MPKSARKQKKARAREQAAREQASRDATTGVASSQSVPAEPTAQGNLFATMDMHHFTSVRQMGNQQNDRFVMQVVQDRPWSDMYVTDEEDKFLELSGREESLDPPVVAPSSKGSDADDEDTDGGSNGQIEQDPAAAGKGRKMQQGRVKGATFNAGKGKSILSRDRVKKHFFDSADESEDGIGLFGNLVSAEKQEKQASAFNAKFGPDAPSHAHNSHDSECEIVEVRQIVKEDSSDCQIIAVRTSPSKLPNWYVQDNRKTETKVKEETSRPASQPKIKVEPRDRPQQGAIAIKQEPGTEHDHRSSQMHDNASNWATQRQPTSSAHVDLTIETSQDEESDLPDYESPEPTENLGSKTQSTKDTTRPIDESDLPDYESPEPTGNSASKSQGTKNIARPIDGSDLPDYESSEPTGHFGSTIQGTENITRPTELATPGTRDCVRDIPIPYWPRSGQSGRLVDTSEGVEDANLESGNSRTDPSLVGIPAYPIFQPISLFRRDNHESHAGGGQNQTEQVTPDRVPKTPTSGLGNSEASVASSPTAYLPRDRAKTQPAPRDVPPTSNKPSFRGLTWVGDRVLDERRNRVNTTTGFTPINPKPVLTMGNQFIKDGVAEHAIQQTLRRLKRRIDAGLEFHHLSRGQHWDASGINLIERGAYGARTVSMELLRRGVKTQTQVDNFWNNLTLEYSRIAGLSMPVLSMRIKAQNDFYEECLELQAELEGRRNKEAKEKEKKQLTPSQELELWKQEEANDDDDTDDDDDDNADLKTLLRKQREKKKKDAVASASPAAVLAAQSLVSMQGGTYQQSIPTNASAFVQSAMQGQTSLPSQEHLKAAAQSSAGDMVPGVGDASHVHACTSDKSSKGRKRHASEASTAATNVPAKKPKSNYQTAQAVRPKPMLLSKNLERFYAQYKKKLEKQKKL